MANQITLEQWRSLIAVVDAGGYAQAAEILHKSQSAVSYSVQKIESQLDLKVFEVQGRKAVLTPIGQMLYRRALALLDEANDLEIAAQKLSAGWEAEIQLAAEIVFPAKLLLTCLDRFSQESPRTRIELLETVRGGTAEVLNQGSADLVISPLPPVGFLGELLIEIQLIAVAHFQHPLHQLGRQLTDRDLRKYRHLVVRDTGSKRDRVAVSVEVDQRWTVSQMSSSIQAVSMGYGFAWLPQLQIRDQLESGILKPLDLREGSSISIPLYLIMRNQDFAGPGVRRLAEIIKQTVADFLQAA